MRNFEKNIRLGTFVLGGLILLILLLYLIGKNRNLFGSNFTLKAKFDNVHGLEAGNNVRFGGINVGTVDELNFINDTLIEVRMLLNKKVRNIIRNNAEASIGSDGLVGNKIVNITAINGYALFAVPGDYLKVRKTTDTDQMLQTLNTTNTNLRIITDSTKNIISKFSKSKLLNILINDQDIGNDIKITLSNIKAASNKIDEAANNINDISKAVRLKKGTIGKLIYDTASHEKIIKTFESIETAGQKIAGLSERIDTIAINVNYAMKNQNNSVGLVFKDSVLSNNISSSIMYIKESARHFDENMKALQHNIFFRGYFKKQKKKTKE
jgi:phospholipid/cholesterol/gamma-HCH transport system substrate-binding protein